MDELPPVSTDRLPTLTEVVDLGPEEPSAAGAASVLTASSAAGPDLRVTTAPGTEELGAGVHEVAAPAPVDLQALTLQVLGELQPRVDMLFESRLREALAPALARVADGLIRDTRDQLALSLRELVEESVSRALQRHR